MPQLVLASTSPFRRELLQKLQLAFTTDSPDIDESRQDGETPRKRRWQWPRANPTA